MSKSQIAEGVIGLLCLYLGYRSLRAPKMPWADGDQLDTFGKIVGKAPVVAGVLAVILGVYFLAAAVGAIDVAHEIVR